jgi:PiT family inorganic phosphate transporter
MASTLLLATSVAAGAASLFTAWALGAGSSGSTPFAPAVGANAVSVLRAGFMAGLLGFAGAVLQGENVTQAVGRELVRGVTLSPTAATLVLVLAAGLVAAGVFLGYPIATAFTVTGAVVGAGLAQGGAPAWAKYQQVGALWILTPPVGGGIAYVTARTLRAEGVRERVAVPILAGLVGALAVNVELGALGAAGEATTLAEAAAAAAGQPSLAGRVGATVIAGLAVAALQARAMGRSEGAGQRRMLLALGGLVAFSAGGSQIGLAIGPLLPLLDPFGIPLLAVLVGGGLGLLAGSWTGAPRMIKALSQDYSSLGPRRGIAALVPSFAIAQAAVLYGIPVSFNEIVVSGIVGSGFAAGPGGVSARKIAYTVLAWIGSLVLALALGYGGMTALEWIL